jgi:opacity protein-like surface antigen
MRSAVPAGAVAAVLVLTAPVVPIARAADLSAHPVIADASMIPEEIGTGWYLRGDIGGSFNRASGFGYNDATFANAKIGDSYAPAIGFGYQFNDFVRADLTIDRVNTVSLSGSATCAWWTTTDCTNVASTTATAERGSLSAVSVMLNGYADLGSWSGITPYIGAGVGAAYVRYGAHQSTTSGSTAADRVFGARDDWTLAANAMAGLSYVVADGLMLDVGYRFLWIDNAQSGAETTSLETGRVGLHDLTAHQVRVGLRYYLY